MEDKIEKTIDLKAPIERVWRALTDHKEFSAWFLVALESPFAVGETTAGNITYEGYEHMRLEATVTTMETNKLFAFNWNPYDDGETKPGETPQTLVEFKLEEVDGGTRLTVIESGFSKLPDDQRRVDAIRRNAGGWEQQVQNIANHVGA